MLSRNQDFERAVAEFDHVFSRIPLRVCASQDDGRMHIPSSGGRAVQPPSHANGCAGMAFCIPRYLKMRKAALERSGRLSTGGSALRRPVLSLSK
jgi:hypothetical protein